MEKNSALLRRAFAVLVLVVAAVVTAREAPLAASPVTPQDVLGLRTIASAEISPNGEWIAYTVRVPRAPGDKPGERLSGTPRRIREDRRDEAVHNGQGLDPFAPLEPRRFVDRFPPEEGATRTRPRCGRYPSTGAKRAR